MVVVEFFSDTPIDNMISTLTGCPDKVILVGQSKIIKRSGQNYKKFLASIGNDRTEIDYCSIIPHNLGNIVKALEKIVMEYSECHFDLTGGDELAMAAIGIISGPVLSMTVIWMDVFFLLKFRVLQLNRILFFMEGVL